MTHWFSTLRRRLTSTDSSRFDGCRLISGVAHVPEVVTLDSLLCRQHIDELLAETVLVAGISVPSQKGLTKRWSRLAIASCGMVRLLAASCSTFSLGHEYQSQSQSQSRVGETPLAMP